MLTTLMHERACFLFSSAVGTKPRAEIHTASDLKQHPLLSDLMAPFEQDVASSARNRQYPARRKR